jgi:hypothetical protein
MPPTPTARQSPAGIKLDEGFSTKITFARDPNIEFWEKTVKPPGLDGGDPVDTTTMHNVTYRTFNPRKLKTMTAMTTKAAYDPVAYDSILALINVKDTVTVTFSDGSTLAFYGYLQKFEPDDIDEGKQPEAGITIMPTNQHPTTGAETAAVLASVTGT